MDERLLYEAKKAALEKSIPFHRFVEEAVEQYIRKGSAEFKTAAERRNGRISGISEKPTPYRVQTSGTSPPGAFSVPLEERWKRALEVIGKYRSGRNDISERHDEFAAEAFAAEEGEE